MLIGADAQPDATVGRRRFWRGNFLFTPDTQRRGRGLQGVPPDRAPTTSSKALVALDDRAIAASRDFPAASREQYEGTLDDFYARMDQLIYPRPVARARPHARAWSTRCTSRWSGASRPSTWARRACAERNTRRRHARGLRHLRDLGRLGRLRHALARHAPADRDRRGARAFPRRCALRPTRFGVARRGTRARAGRRQPRAAAVGRASSATRAATAPSSSSSLADVVARVAQLEIAYNPNDCPESRWGAQEGSDEYAPCKRSAPREQRETMEKYRTWFHDRARPARP